MCPIFLKTPWFTIYSYGLLVAIGYTIAMLWTMKEAKKDGLDSEAFFDMFILQLIIGIMGSRFLYLLEYAPQTLSLKTFFAFEKGGLTFYGAAISGFAFNVFFLKIKRIPIWRALDCVGFGMPLIAISRLGCFMNGCCYGTRCSMPWGVIFPKASSYPVHPTQIYEVICGLAIFVLLQKLRPFRRNYGEVFLAHIGLYGFLRFFIEFYRAENPIVLLGMTLAQLIGIAIVFSSLICWHIINKTKQERIMPNTDAVELNPTVDSK